jgi:8-oxo-dGTP pyrophosphatase MutT (NUDIX family)
MKTQFPCTNTLRHSITQNLAAHECELATESTLRKAAVTVLLVANEINEACIILTRRPAKLKRHAGQYALPGGKLEDGETEVLAALRETHEEVGVALGASQIIGRLDDFQTRSGYCISPIVVWAGPDTILDPDPNEVEQAFRIPLWDLANPDIPELRESENSDQPILCAKLATLGHRIFAPTAAILYQFREIALFGRSTRVAHFEQPRFAWK